MIDRELLAGLSPGQHENSKVNNLLIPTGPNAGTTYQSNGGVATFRDENIELNGQSNDEQLPQYDALGYGTFQPD